MHLHRKVRDTLDNQPSNPLKWVVTTAGALLFRDGAKARRRSLVSKLRGKAHGRHTTAILLKRTRG